MNEKKTGLLVETFRIPKGCFCEDGYCGDCMFLDTSKRGSSGTTYYCPQLDTYRKPTENSKYECSHFRRR